MPGGGGKSQTVQQQTSNSVSGPEPWVQDTGKGLFDRGQAIIDQPAHPYTGDLTIDPAAATTTATGLLTNAAAGGNGAATYGSAADILKSVGAYGTGTTTAPTVGNGSILGMDRSAYTNPYINDVVDASMSDLDKQRVQALMGNDDAAKKAGAFGGSRQAITNAVTNSETAQKAGLLSAQLRGQAFDTASGLMTGDAGRAQSAESTNASNFLTGKSLDNAAANTRLAAGTGLAGVQTAQNASNVANASTLLGAGASDESRQAANNAAAQGEWARLDKDSQDKLTWAMSLLNATPSDTITNSTGTGVSNTKTSTSPDFATSLLGGVKLLASFSEDKAKTDIEKVGKGPNDLDLFAYRYKSDPKTYPKVVGLMASDVEKKVPGAVTKMKGGKRMVNYRAALSLDS